MFAMSQHQYAYHAVPAAAPRQYASHGTSSAFSPSANPDEDWTKISDLAERRRIQNRIAQRNYRKKLKRRLEDLERRAGSDNATPTEKQPASSNKKSSRQPVSKSQKMTPPQKSTAAQFTPPLEPNDDILYAPQEYGRERSQTPPLFSYSTYPPPEDVMIQPYSSTPGYSSLSAAQSYPSYLSTAVPVTLPSMTHFNDAIKNGNDNLSPYVNYGFMAAMDLNASASYEHSNPHTPPLSHSFDHSATCSDAGYEYPTTPLSMPGSPGMVHQ